MTKKTTWQVHDIHVVEILLKLAFNTNQSKKDTLKLFSSKTEFVITKSGKMKKMWLCLMITWISDIEDQIYNGLYTKKELPPVHEGKVVCWNCA